MASLGRGSPSWAQSLCIWPRFQLRSRYQLVSFVAGSKNARIAHSGSAPHLDPFWSFRHACEGLRSHLVPYISLSCNRSLRFELLCRPRRRFVSPRWQGQAGRQRRLKIRRTMSANRVSFQHGSRAGLVLTTGTASTWEIRGTA